MAIRKVTRFKKSEKTLSSVLRIIDIVHTAQVKAKLIGYIVSKCPTVKLITQFGGWHKLYGRRQQHLVRDSGSGTFGQGPWIRVQICETLLNLQIFIHDIHFILWLSMG